MGGGAQNSEWIWKDHLEHHTLTNKLLSCAPCWAGTVSTRTRESKTMLLATYGPPQPLPRGPRERFHGNIYTNAPWPNKQVRVSYT